MKPASIAGHLLELVTLVERGPEPPDRIVAPFFRNRKYLGSKERRVLADLLFGFIRHRRRVEAVFEDILRKHPELGTTDVPPRRFVPLLLVHIAIAQGSSDGPRYSTADLRPFWTAHFPDIGFPPLAEWALESNSLGFLDQQHAGDPAVMLGVRHSFQDWMVEQWMTRWPDATEALLDALNHPAPVTLRVNSLKTDRRLCVERLVAEGIAATEAEFPDSAMILARRFAQNTSETFREGWFEVQDIGSQIVSLVCAPAPGQLVIDACAGAGGKSLHMAALMENSGKIVALDTDLRRLSELSRRIQRSGAAIIEPVLRGNFREEAYAAAADLVIVDAPCSGSGTIRRNPMLKWKVTEDDIGRFSEKQSELLHSYAGLVKPGGRLVYSTCSLMKAENEDVVSGFLSSDAAFRPSPIDLGPGRRVGSGRIEPDGHTLLLLPHVHQTDGFFMASMERTG